MAKIGRNQPCFCGSGKKYKRCHGSYEKSSPSRLHDDLKREMSRKFREMEAERAQRESQQGVGRGIVSMQSHGHRMVAVGNTVLFSPKWKTFHDFLRDFLIDKLGRDWFSAELRKAEPDRHQIVQWYSRAVEDARRGTKVGDITTSPMTGAQRAFLNLAYNVYLIAHHAEVGKVDSLLDEILTKLRSSSSADFIGKLFETYAAAAFIKAGFTLAYEDESRGRQSHVEFVATHPKSGKKFSVEVKARNRAPNQDGPTDDVKRLRVGDKLKAALSKRAEHTRVVLIEVNVPDILSDVSLEGWPRAALDQIRFVANTPLRDGSVGESAYVLVTNHSFHNNLDVIGAGTQVLAAGCRIADFGPEVGFSRFKEWLESKARHSEMYDLLQSMRTHYDIPSTFNGENPELAFLPPDALPPPLKFGNWYMVRGSDGREIEARLYEAIVNEDDQTVMGVYETAAGEHILAQSPLTDEEFAAWKLHPETFFGEIRPARREVTNWLELAEFFYETYQHTPREKLLEWMRDARDFAELSALPQSELAIVFCERKAWALDQCKGRVKETAAASQDERR